MVTMNNDNNSNSIIDDNGNETIIWKQYIEWK
jgi:hypothetical protein